MLFDFEHDFAGSLRCIPMIVRQKLDLVKIKMTLRQWSRIPHESRLMLVNIPCETEIEQEKFHMMIISLIKEYSDEAIKFINDIDYHSWKGSLSCPQEVKKQAESDKVMPPSDEAWQNLTELQRFALIKLASSKHENMNFVPALKEFGLL